jgi:hypothetical protein
MPASAIHLLTGSAAALLVSAAARALPEPLPGGSRFYSWFYRFAHYLLANFDKTEGKL